MQWLLVVSVTVLAVAGCQTYRPEPIDVGSALSTWRERSATVAPTDPAGLSLAEAEEVALVLNPALRKARAELQVARAGAREAGRWDDPSIALDLERILSGADDPWVVGGLVNLSIPLSRRLGLEQKLATGELDVAALRVLVAERETIADLRRAWARWSAGVARAKAVESAVDDLRSIETRASRLRDAGEIDPTDARLFAIDRVRRGAQCLSVNRQNAQSEARLRELLGLTPDAPVKFVASPLVERVEAPLQSHPRVALSLASYEAAERALELEIAKQYPDLELGGGMGSDEGDSRLLGGVSIPLPLLNANRRAIAEARARRDAARAEVEAEVARLESARALARREVVAAREAIEFIEREVAPLVDRQLAEARKLLEAGEFNPLLVREAIDAATDARLDLIDARLALDEAVVEHLSLTESLPEPKR